jgi:hypothetical protein
LGVLIGGKPKAKRAVTGAFARREPHHRWGVPALTRTVRGA